MCWKLHSSRPFWVKACIFYFLKSTSTNTQYSVLWDTQGWVYYISRNFRKVFTFREFCELNYKGKNKNSPNILPSFINEKLVPPKAWKRNTTSVDAKLLNLEDLSLHAMTISCNISQQISLKLAMLQENIHLFNDMIYACLVSCIKTSLVAFLMTFSSWKMCRWLMFGDNCKLTRWAYWL